MGSLRALIERGDPASSLFYLNGFTRLTPDRKVFIVQCAVVSRLSESILLELLSDPRVGLVLGVELNPELRDVHLVPHGSPGLVLLRVGLRRGLVHLMGAARPRRQCPRGG